MEHTFCVLSYNFTRILSLAYLNVDASRPVSQLRIEIGYEEESPCFLLPHLGYTDGSVV